MMGGISANRDLGGFTDPPQSVIQPYTQSIWIRKVS
jgi:hypothetical protein